ncbi:MAG: peptidylprolyl isomerase [bacterium]
MRKQVRLSILFLCLPVFAALVYGQYYQSSRRAWMDRLVQESVIALFEDGRVTREDLRFYFENPPKEERSILQALELSPEDVTGIGLVEKDLELLHSSLGQLLIQNIIKHIAIVKYLDRYPDSEHVLEGQDPIQKYREEIMAESLENELARFSPLVTQEEMLAYYVDNPDLFHREGKRLARYIMLSGESRGATEEAEAGRPVLSRIVERLRQGEDFQSLAEECGAIGNNRGGVLGWVRRGALHQNFDQALWALDVGEITGPVLVGQSTHFIQLLDEQPEGLIPFEECKSKIRTILEENKRTIHRYEAVGLPPNLAEDGGEPDEEYRQALLRLAYARGFNKKEEVIQKTEAYRRYQKADRLFQEMVEQRQRNRNLPRGTDSNWILESETVNRLLDRMDFRLLVKLNTPKAGEGEDVSDPADESVKDE